MAHRPLEDNSRFLKEEGVRELTVVSVAELPGFAAQNARHAKIAENVLDALSEIDSGKFSPPLLCLTCNNELTAACMPEQFGVMQHTRVREEIVVCGICPDCAKLPKDELAARARRALLGGMTGAKDAMNDPAAQDELDLVNRPAHFHTLLLGHGAAISAVYQTANDVMSEKPHIALIDDSGHGIAASVADRVSASLLHKAKEIGVDIVLPVVLATKLGVEDARLLRAYLQKTKGRGFPEPGQVMTWVDAALPEEILALH